MGNPKMPDVQLEIAGVVRGWEVEPPPRIVSGAAKARSASKARRAMTREIMGRLERDAAVLTGRFGLAYRVLEPEGPRVKSRYGVCFSDGTLRIRLFHATTGQPLRYSSLIDTLCHELAHLRHFNHGQRFQSLYRRILEHARREGIYRPRLPTPMVRRRSSRESTPRVAQLLLL
jgi:predicted metal-dependent hydrolase